MMMRGLYIVLTMLVIFVLEFTAYSFALDDYRMPSMLVATSSSIIQDISGNTFLSPDRNDNPDK